ncbi:hypothetical protein REPUB_Repub17cG0012700 [Reevesia pubescens]
MQATSNQSTRNYDPNGNCDYHMEAIGHSIQKCRQLREKIEELTMEGTLTPKLMEQWKVKGSFVFVFVFCFLISFSVFLKTVVENMFGSMFSFSVFENNKQNFQNC